MTRRSSRLRGWGRSRRKVSEASSNQGIQRRFVVSALNAFYFAHAVSFSNIRQLAGIVTMGALLVVSASASAIRFCTTVNAYFESKSLRSTQ